MRIDVLCRSAPQNNRRHVCLIGVLVYLLSFPVLCTSHMVRVLATLGALPADHAKLYQGRHHHNLQALAGHAVVGAGADILRGQEVRSQHGAGGCQGLPQGAVIASPRDRPMGIQPGATTEHNGCTLEFGHDCSILTANCFTLSASIHAAFSAIHVEGHFMQMKTCNAAVLLHGRVSECQPHCGRRRRKGQHSKHRASDQGHPRQCGAVRTCMKMDNLACLRRPERL